MRTIACGAQRRGRTARNGMRIVVRSILFRTDVAERSGTKGDHSERPFVDNVAGGRKGMSLGLVKITRGRIYNGQGQCGRKVPGPPARNGQDKQTQPACAKFSNALCPPAHTRKSRGANGFCDSPALHGFWGLHPLFAVRVVFHSSRSSGANGRRNHILCLQGRCSAGTRTTIEPPLWCELQRFRFARRLGRDKRSWVV